MKKGDIKLNYDDITIVPARTTEISSRTEVDPYDDSGFLPIFASCMSSIVSLENVDDYNKAKIRVVLPRSYSISERLGFMCSLKGRINFTAYSLQEVRDIFINGGLEEYGADEVYRYNICIDLANGHMDILLKTVMDIKRKWGDRVCVMTGNIANPETYLDYCNVGVDYARISIGTGNVCSTSSNTGIHYPVFSLLQEIYNFRKNVGGSCKIIADGGIRGYRDIQKALLYADSVMIGSLFGRAIESAGKTTYGKSYWNIRGYKLLRPLKTLLTYGREIPREKFSEVYKEIKEGKLTAWKEVYGMSTKIAQAVVAEANAQDLKKLKTAEGLVKYQKVEYNLSGWSENETDYLRSAMSYTNSKTLEEYKDSDWVEITQIRYNN